MPAKRLEIKAVMMPQKNPAELPRTAPHIIIIKDAGCTEGIDKKRVRPAEASAARIATAHMPFMPSRRKLFEVPSIIAPSIISIIISAIVICEYRKSAPELSCARRRI